VWIEELPARAEELADVGEADARVLEDRAVEIDRDGPIER